MSWRKVKTPNEGNEFMFVAKRKERLARLRKEKAEALKLARKAVLDEYEQAVEAHAAQVVIGIDEVGTGALAGPVVIGAVVMMPGDELDVKDSKAYNYYAKKRMEAYHRVMSSDKVIYQTTETVEITELIEKGQANAMRAGYSRLVDRVVTALAGEYDRLLVAMDGKVAIATEVPQVTIIKGDEFITPISAASVIAKIYRDGLMSAADSSYPGYKFGKHKGYGTADHMQILKALGPCEIHRTYIARIQKALEKRKRDEHTRDSDQSA